MSEKGKLNAITDVMGIKVGHFTDLEHLTGVTVLRTPEGSLGGVDVRGGSPGTRETDLLSPVNRIKRVDAVTLCGSSAYGLNSVAGVMRSLEESGIGHPIAEGRVVPIVPAAVIYDLCRGESDRYIDEVAGYEACSSVSGGPVEQGNVGAGTGALSGGTKGGLGTASEVLENGITVAAIVIVNSSGTAFDPETGGFYARGLELGGEFGGLRRDLPARMVPRPVLYRKQGQHTTIGVIATDAQLDKSQATKMAQMAHDGLARAIYPAHTMFDGDTLFSVATGTKGALGEYTSDSKDGDRALSQIGVSAADAVSRAVIHAIISAGTVGKYTCYRDKFPDSF
ncbi:MAG TPA: P1 family peptidase [Patescibacteria group bacterium]|nr:P1 family peptidase [Patescibacteria group bacterium]